MSLAKTIDELKSRKGFLIQKKENPTYNLILMSHELDKDFLNNVRNKKELEDIKTIWISKKKDMIVRLMS